MKTVLRIAGIFGLGLVLVGCQQKMADQPYHRPMSESSMFDNKQSARPLDPDTVHRNQLLSNDPLATWLTPEGKNLKPSKEWLDLVDPSGKTTIPPGAPSDVKNFVAEFPIQLTEADFHRGEYLYRTICAHCHGGAGHANGKVQERGFLRPPSFHLDPEGKKKDWSTLNSKGEPEYTGNPQGTSRGFYRYNKVVPIKDIPVGYIVQVITWGYGGMAAHDTQVPDFADRWRLAAHIRALQLSQSAEPNGDIKKKIEEQHKAHEVHAKPKGEHTAGEKH